MKFPGLFLTFSWLSPNFYWLFAAWKYDILTFAGIHKGLFKILTFSWLFSWPLETLVILFLMFFPNDVMFLSKTGQIKWMISQHCGYWWPGHHHQDISSYSAEYPPLHFELFCGQSTTHHNLAMQRARTSVTMVTISFSQSILYFNARRD